MTTIPLPTGSYNAARDMIDRNVDVGLADKIAFIDPKHSLTYGALQDSANRFGNAAMASGLPREARVIMIMLDTVDFPVVFWGAIKAGLQPVPLNTLLTVEQWRYMIEDSRAGMVVISAELAERAADMLAEISARRPLKIVISGEHEASLEAFLAKASNGDPDIDTHAEDVAFWLYSSGSTGMPKGTRHVHSSPMFTARAFGHGIIGIGRDDVIFSAAKLFFAYGLGNGMSFPMSVGATTILLPDRPTPDSVGAILRAHNPTIFCGVPTLFGAMLATGSLQKGAGSNRLRLCTSAGEALPEDLGLRWQNTVGVEIVDGIGSTEMLHIFVSNRPGRVAYGTSGTPVSGYEAKLLDDDGSAVAPGDVGELVVKGASAADGYWLQREKSRRTFRGEWTHTGDKYRIREDGMYVYCGRTDDMFKVSGIWVSPFEVESALITHPAVLEAAVVGAEDSDTLIKPKAFVVLKAGQTGDASMIDALKAHVKAQAGAWKYPRWVEFRSELPKTATGKIQRFKLREEA